MCCFPTWMFTSGPYIWPRRSSSSHILRPTDLSTDHCTMLSHITFAFSTSFAHIVTFLLFQFCAYVCLEASHPRKLLGKSMKPVRRKGINRVQEGNSSQNKATAQHGGSATCWKSKEFDRRFEDKQKSLPDKFR